MFKQYLDNFSSALTNFIASYSFCSSVIPSMGEGLIGSGAPVTGFNLDNKIKQILHQLVIFFTYRLKQVKPYEYICHLTLAKLH